MNRLSQLREQQNHSADAFESLVLRYQRQTREYAKCAREMLTDFALWDGGGRGASLVFWKKILELEQKREGIRVGSLGDLLNYIEAAGDDVSKCVDISDGYAHKGGYDWRTTRRVVRCELIRRYVVRAVTVLKKAYGSDVGPYSETPPDGDAIGDAQQLLRRASDLDRR